MNKFVYWLYTRLPKLPVWDFPFIRYTKHTGTGIAIGVGPNCLYFYAGYKIPEGDEFQLGIRVALFRRDFCSNTVTAFRFAIKCLCKLDYGFGVVTQAYLRYLQEIKRRSA